MNKKRSMRESGDGGRPPPRPVAGARSEAQARALVRLNALSSLLWQTRNIQDGLDAGLRAAAELVGADGGIVRLLDRERKVFRIAARHGFEGRFLGRWEEVAAARGSQYCPVLQQSGRIVIEDVTSGTGFPEFRAIARTGGFRALQSTPLIGRDGNAVGVLTTHWRAPHAPGRVDCLTLDLCAQQIWSFVERCRADEALHRNDEAAYRLAAIVQSSDDAIVSKDLDGIITSWNAGAERLFGYPADEAIGQSITMIIPPDRPDEEPRILDRIRRGEKIRHFETVRRHKDGALIDVSLTVSPVRDREGRIVGASKIARDISERRAAEKHRDLLVAELSHRVKNTLATVTSIARHSFHNEASVAVARTSFEKRLQALAENHSRLAVTGWSGVAMDEIFDYELAPYNNGENVTISGPAVVLKAQCALPLGMAAHELATNAAKYGALSVDSGSVAVTWRVDKARGQLTVRWSERGGPPTQPPSTRGFGRLMLERALAADLEGEVKMDFASAGLTCTIRIPLDACSFGSNGTGGSEPPAPGRGTPRHTPSVSADSRAQSRILVVEDEFLLASVLTNDLASAGYSVVGPFLSLQPARATSQKERIDLAVLDINLGDETVYPLADELMERKMPFILLSGMQPEALPPRYRRLPLLTKPYDASRLLLQIEQLVSRPDYPGMQA